MKMMVITVVNGGRGTIPKDLGKALEELEIRIYGDHPD